MDAPFTLSFDRFWAWLQNHPHCIIRAATPEAILYDDEDLHWHFALERDGTPLVQLMRGKRLLGEIFIDREKIAYAQAVLSERKDEHQFELMTEAESDVFAAYFFVLSHGYDEESQGASGRVH